MQKEFGMHNKIILHNPHTLFFKENLICHLAGKKSFNKYDYLFDHIYFNNSKIYVYLDKSFLSSFSTGPLKFLKHPKVDFYAWVLLNRLNPFKFKFISCLDNLMSYDVFFSFLYGPFAFSNYEINLAKENLFIELKNSPAFKILHLSHFGYVTKNNISNIICSNFHLFVSENNLNKNSNYFKSLFYFNNNDVLVLPFVPNERFYRKDNFNVRINKVLMTGTNTHRMKNDDFMNFFGNDILQPMRKYISENQNELKDYIDPLINNLQATSNNNERISGENYVLNKIKYFFGDFYRLFYLFSKFILNISRVNKKNENDYYKVDIVEKYNQYKMFIVPEEIIGLPGIGFVEGMSCGSAYIGLRDPMYNDLGLKEGIHYIGYDGTLNDLISKIIYYQQNENELETIAKNGYFFIKEHFNKDKVAKEFFNNINKKMNFKENI